MTESARPDWHLLGTLSAISRLRQSSPRQTRQSRLRQAISLGIHWCAPSAEDGLAAQLGQHLPTRDLAFAAKPQAGRSITNQRLFEDGKME
jgi:hypothetical protein